MNTNDVDDIIALFCNVDDFCLAFEPEFNKRLLEDGTRKRIRKSKLCLSEVMTIIISRSLHKSGDWSPRVRLEM